MFAHRYSLGLIVLALFLAALVGQGVAGWAQFNDQQAAHGLAEVGLGRYLRSADFAVDVTQNWQSEFLRLLLYVVAAMSLLPRGSTRGPRWMLAAALGAVFLGSWLAQSIAGWAAFNEARMQQLQDPIGWGAYLGNPDFWSRTLQNWQSEFLAVGFIVVLAICLRQRGSAGSEPVGRPHDSTGP